MTPKKETIKEFFQGDKQYIIPVYQRAYSWEEKQWEVFLRDLEEAAKGKNNYFFGNILIERLEGKEAFDVIDGQQRMTTISIFMRSMHDVLSNRAKNETIDNNLTNQEFLQYLQEDYLINRSKAKIQTVEYDRDYFRDVITYGGDIKHSPQTLSQERILNAKKFFKERLEKIDTKNLVLIFEVIQKSEILSIPFENKKDSVLMFELQNNRGKDLTNLEKLKSYLAYQIYTYSPTEESEAKLREITSVFEEIYRLLKDINLDEDRVLNYFNISRAGFDYRENDDSKNYKKELKNIEKDKKIEWIEGYTRELKNAFVDFKDFEKSENIFKDWLFYLNVGEIYPFIIKAYRLFRDEKEKIGEICKILEIMAFRHKIVKTRADLASRLNVVLKNFEDIQTLIDGIKNICSEYIEYWSDDAIRNALVSLRNLDVVPYVFMRYENFLRSKSTRTKGYLFSLKELEKPEIEHIAPRVESDEKISRGYCKYDKEFTKEYLHSIGNLLLIDKAHNGSIGNRPFGEKKASYKDSPLFQQREVENFQNEEKWDKASIDNRHEKIEDFIISTWGFENI